MSKKVLCLVFSLISLCSCSIQRESFEPEISFSPPPRILKELPSAFPPLTEKELETEYGKELFLGLQFAKDLDLYRAITCYKRAYYLAPEKRKNEISYHIVEAYYIGGKYQEVVETYEESALDSSPIDFPALKELLMMLEDSYLHIDMPEKACRIHALLEKFFPKTAEKFEEYRETKEGNLCYLYSKEEKSDSLNVFLCEYAELSKSPEKAKFLNAVLPGAGYYYVGQTKTAVTSFVINALFTWGAYRFFERGYPAAGIIMASLETGWYFGGINGAGIAAREWNERVYEVHGKEHLRRDQLFPVLQFEYAF